MRGVCACVRACVRVRASVRVCMGGVGGGRFFLKIGGWLGNRCEVVGLTDIGRWDF